MSSFFFFGTCEESHFWAIFFKHGEPSLFEAYLSTKNGTNTTTSEEFYSRYETALAIFASNMDDLFLGIMGSVILLMQAGFAFLEAGSVRAKNTTNILIKNFADLCFGECFEAGKMKECAKTFLEGGSAFWIVGYALAFGKGNAVIGHSNFAAVGLPYKKYTFLFFQVRKKI